MINAEGAEEPAGLVDARHQVRKNSSLMDVTIAYKNISCCVDSVVGGEACACIYLGCGGCCLASCGKGE